MCVTFGRNNEMILESPGITIHRMTVITPTPWCRATLR